MAKAIKKFDSDAENVNETANIDNTVNDVVDIDLSSIKKKRFRINGDNNLIIELNTSDMNILVRYEQAIPKFTALEEKVENLGKVASEDQNDGEVFAATTQALKDVDDGMKELIDFIFDSPIADKCTDGGTMYDVFGGKFRYEHILDKFMALYEDNLANEYRLMKKRVNKYAKK